MQQREERLQLLEYKTKPLKSANKQLNLQINSTADQLAACQDYQKVTDMLGNRNGAQKPNNYVQCLEDWKVSSSNMKKKSSRPPNYIRH